MGNAHAVQVGRHEFRSPGPMKKPGGCGETKRKSLEQAGWPDWQTR